MRFARLVPLLMLLAACRHQGASYAPVPSGLSAETRAGLARLRAATNRYHDLDTAVAAGYPAMSNQCYIEPGSGAMGYHHVNRALLTTNLEVERPQVLLYERAADGKYNLTAVEYIVPYRMWPKDSTPPTVMGMPLGHVDVLNVWGLHMWIWKQNPRGMFEWWNPEVRCLADQTRMPEHS